MPTPISFDGLFSVLQKAPAAILFALAVGISALLFCDVTGRPAWLDLGLLRPILVVADCLAASIAIGKVIMYWIASHQPEWEAGRRRSRRDADFLKVREKLQTLGAPALMRLHKCYRTGSREIKTREDDPGIQALHRAGFVSFCGQTYSYDRGGQLGVYLLQQDILDHIRERDFFNEVESQFNEVESQQ
ncbi:hypothetical protein [Maricaulis sp.]|uniref:hypothetical protein n=1 Tax=Maricaulis sp. TaxID=1486257 RepID=UPI003A8F4D55